MRAATCLARQQPPKKKKAPASKLGARVGKGPPVGDEALAYKKSSYRNVRWKSHTKPGNRGWFGLVHRQGKDVRTAHYHTDEEAAREVDK